MAKHLPSNWQELSDEKLLELKYLIEKDLDRVKAQIDEAETFVKLYGQYSKPDWFFKVNNAKRGLGRESQAIQLEFNRRKKESKNNHKQEKISFERIFMKIAKRKLKEEVYQFILNETEQELKED